MRKRAPRVPPSRQRPVGSAVFPTPSGTGTEPHQIQPALRPRRTELFLPGTRPGCGAQPPPCRSPAPEGRPSEGRPGRGAGAEGTRPRPGPPNQGGKGRGQRGRGRGAREARGVPRPGRGPVRRVRAAPTCCRSPARLRRLCPPGCPARAGGDSMLWSLAPHVHRARHARWRRPCRPARTPRRCARGAPCGPRRRVPAALAGPRDQLEDSRPGDRTPRPASPAPSAPRVRPPSAQPPPAPPPPSPCALAPKLGQVWRPSGQIFRVPHARGREHPPAPHAARCPRTLWGSLLRPRGSGLGPSGLPPQGAWGLRPHPDLRLL